MWRTYCLLGRHQVDFGKEWLRRLWKMTSVFHFEIWQIGLGSDSKGYFYEFYKKTARRGWRCF